MVSLLGYWLRHLCGILECLDYIITLDVNSSFLLIQMLAVIWFLSPTGRPGLNSKFPALAVIRI